MNDQDWKQKLTPEQYHVLREKGTELPFSGKYNLNKKDGMYICAACKTPLFSSEHKFDSGSGWPSFYQSVNENKIKLTPDISLGMERTEVACATCGGHLGHVFPDGPQDKTGQRFCINSLALSFEDAQKLIKE